MALRIERDGFAFCSVYRHFAYDLTWLPERNYNVGTEVELRTKLFRQFCEWTMHHIEMERADVLFSPEIKRAGPDALQNRKLRLLFKAKLLRMVRRGEPVTIRLAATPSLYAGMDLELLVWVRTPAGAGADLSAEVAPTQLESEQPCRLTVKAGPVERLSVYARPFPGPGGTVRTCIVPEDRYGNPSAFERPVKAEWTWAGRTGTLALCEAAVLELDAPERPERAEVRIRMDALTLRENIANGEVAEDALVVRGNPVQPERVDGLRPAFGEIHWHTEEASGKDGGRAMTEALRCARDELNMDFAAPSDHDPTGAEWERTVAAVDAFNENDSFATLYGWENSTNRGHENYYFTTPDHEAVRGGKAGFAPNTLEEATAGLDAFPPERVLAVPHHTNSSAALKRDGVPAWHPYNWLEPRPYRRLAEIVQHRGNQERNDYDDAWRGMVQRQFASVQDALRAGHRLGFTGGTDNHVGWPGRVVHQQRKSVILTGVWTTRVAREPVFDALWRRHTWAVIDTRAIVWFAVGGVPMGGELPHDDSAELTAVIRIRAEAPLQSIEIVSDGETVWSASSSSPFVDLHVPLGKPPRPTYYYMRALQRDGGFMYASPVFVVGRQPAGKEGE
ncbi:MAG: DUF3604 domain-containing protein [Paenibacillaceae bacterium]|nr:DUF3604 domain-containing protein [Paenibacillaceae bacterium]